MNSKSLTVLVLATAAVVAAALLRVANRPSIDLSVQPSAVVKGKSVTVTWRIDAADSVVLEAGNLQNESVGPVGSRTFHVDGPTLFRIRASNGWPPFLTTRAETRWVDIIAPPTIKVWSADPSEVQVGGVVNLQWETSDAEKVTISGIDSTPIAVEPGGSREVTVDRSKTFEIVAWNQAGSSRRPLLITARAPEPEPSPAAEVTQVATPENASSNTPQSKTTTDTKPQEAISSGAYTTTNRRRLVFLGTQNLDSRLDQVVRPEIENYFRSKGYQIMEPRESAVLTFEDYSRSNSGEGAADYAVVGVGNISDCKDVLNINTKWGNISRQKVDASVTISLFSVANREKIATSRGHGSASSGKTESERYSGSITKAGCDDSKAAEKAVKDALARLKL